MAYYKIKKSLHQGELTFKVVFREQVCHPWQTLTMGLTSRHNAEFYISEHRAGRL